MTTKAKMKRRRPGKPPADANLAIAYFRGRDDARRLTALFSKFFVKELQPATHVQHFDDPERENEEWWWREGFDDQLHEEKP